MPNLAGTRSTEPTEGFGTGGKSAIGSTLAGNERRQLTVICCEVASADAGAPALDPENFYEWMLQLRPLAQRVADSHGGTVGRGLGDRVLIYFGHPKAQEDDARRAVQAALELVAEAGELLKESSGARVGLRAGCTPAWRWCRTTRISRSPYSGPRLMWRCGFKVRRSRAAS